MSQEWKPRGYIP